MPLPNDQTYFLLMAGERACGGVMQAPVAEAPSMWVTWVRVADLDATSGKVEAAGGRLLTEPMVMDGVGRMRVAMDNTGGVFGIITPAAS
jgi:predicted enzyme related to lactoylglutathione lyase